MTITARTKHDLTAEPSEVLRYFRVCLRAWSRRLEKPNKSKAPRERSKAADWALVCVTLLAALFVVVQIRDARSSFNLEERAWVEVESIKKETGALSNYGVPSYPVSFDIIAKNYGKTQAHDFVMKVASIDGDYKTDAEQLGCVGGMLVSNEGNDKIFDHPFPSDPAFLPMGTCTDRYQEWALKKAILPPLIQGNATQEYILYSQTSVTMAKTFVIVGRIEYVDLFGFHHWRTFCYSSVDGTNTIDNCGSGDNEDKELQ